MNIEYFSATPFNNEFKVGSLKKLIMAIVNSCFDIAVTSLHSPCKAKRFILYLYCTTIYFIVLTYIMYQYLIPYYYLRHFFTMQYACSLHECSVAISILHFNSIEMEMDVEVCRDVIA